MNNLRKLKKIKKLSELNEYGVIGSVEFEVMKQNILSKKPLFIKEYIVNSKKKEF